MHKCHILQHIMQCVVSVVYMVICNTVRLIVACREGYVTGRYCYSALRFF